MTITDCIKEEDVAPILCAIPSSKAYLGSKQYVGS